MSRRLFGPEAALWALFGFNAAIYFVVWPDGLILPDVPLFLFLSTAIWIVAEILFGPPRGKLAPAALWLAAGLAFGLAGLAKYSAIFAPSAYSGFWPSRRATGIGFGIPFPIWGGACLRRFHTGSDLEPAAPVGLFFFPVGADRIRDNVRRIRIPPFCRGFGGANRAAFAMDGAPLDWHSGPPRAPASGKPQPISALARRRAAGAVSLMPFLGKTTIPHWFNSAWLFAFPLLGAWLTEERELAPFLGHRERCAFRGSFALLRLTWLWGRSGRRHASPKRDATEWSYNWRGPKNRPPGALQAKARPPSWP